MQLATHALDVVIADTPAPPYMRVRVFNHLLGESDTAFFAPPALAARFRRRFPRSLNERRCSCPPSTRPSPRPRRVVREGAAASQRGW